MIKVVIKVENEGVNFGCRGYVREVVTGEVLHQTRLCPYGMRGVAFQLAESECKARGWDEK